MAAPRTTSSNQQNTNEGIEPARVDTRFPAIHDQFAGSVLRSQLLLNFYERSTETQFYENVHHRMKVQTPRRVRVRSTGESLEYTDQADYSGICSQ